MEFLTKKDVYNQFYETDFFIGIDSFLDVQIDSTQIKDFWYFRNTKKSLIKRFILQETPQTQKICTVTLIKKGEQKFTPRFDFQIWDTTKKACSTFSKEKIDENLIKARVNLDGCYDNFLLLLNFIKSIEDVEFDSESYAIIKKTQKDIFENISKESAIIKFSEKYGKEISEKDISLLQDRRSKIIHFDKLLTDGVFFQSEKKRIETARNRIIKNEYVWQNFFEENPWIFGYGLQLVACEGLDEGKLEKTVVGNDLIDGAGKRIDALLKTKGSISKFLFCEIKLHSPNLLIEPYDRPGVYVPGKELRGAVAQIQKTIHKVTLKLHESIFRPNDSKGNPTGEELLFVKPKGVVVIGKLDDFKTSTGINQEELSSFELYRQQINGIEIITYDELYHRIKFIVEK